MQHMTKEQRAIRDADFEQRLKPRLLWDSQTLGTRLIHPVRPGYSGNGNPVLAKAKAKNLRRRQNKSKRGWLPHAKR